jgi:membrane protein
VLDRLRERFPWLATPLAVHQRVTDVGGGPLSSSIALAGFLSLFPLLLVAIAVLGFVSAGDSDFPADIVEQLGLTGRAADQVLDVIHNAEESRRTASVVGLTGLLWGGLGVVGALGQALDATWQVTGRPGWKNKLVDLGWLAGAGALFLASMALAPTINALPGPAVVPTVLVGLALDTVLFVWMFRALTNVAVPWSDHVPGAVAGALGLEVLKLAGGVYVPRVVSSSSALYGSLGVVFAILAWLALSSRLVVYSSAFNVIRHEQHHGTVTVEIEVPNIVGEVPLQANRGGAVSEATGEAAVEAGRGPGDATGDDQPDRTGEAADGTGRERGDAAGDVRPDRTGDAAGSGEAAGTRAEPGR